MNLPRKRPGLLFTLVAPAGAGKNSLIQYLLERTSLRQLPTATTRPVRPGEQDGREHEFVSEAEFRRMIERGELLENQVIHGNLYGMPRKAVEAAFDSGRSIIADIEVDGTAYARATYPENVVAIFIQVPSIGTLIERMRERGERDAEIGKRLLRVPKEIAYAPRCDYVIMNDDFERAAEILHQIVTAELRGEKPAAPSDPLIEYRYTYVAQMIPVFRNLALRSDTRFFEPKAEFGDGELPHEAALRALHRELNVAIDENAVIGGDKPDGAYLPPMALIYARDSGGERITYVYYYRLDTRLDAPAGWSWVELPETFDAALPERRSEP